MQIPPDIEEILNSARRIKKIVDLKAHTTRIVESVAARNCAYIFNVSAAGDFYMLPQKARDTLLTDETPVTFRYQAMKKNNLSSASFNKVFSRLKGTALEITRLHQDSITILHADALKRIYPGLNPQQADEFNVEDLDKPNTAIMSAAWSPDEPVGEETLELAKIFNNPLKYKTVNAQNSAAVFNRAIAGSVLFLETKYWGNFFILPLEVAKKLRSEDYKPEETKLITAFLHNTSYMLSNAYKASTDIAITKNGEVVAVFMPEINVSRRLGSAYMKPSSEPDRQGMQPK